MRKLLTIVAITAMTLASVTTGAVPRAMADSTSPVGNPGFESPVGTASQPAPRSVGNWTRLSQNPGAVTIDTVTTHFFHGARSARVAGPALASNAAVYFYQDVLSGPALSGPISYELAFSVYPDYGVQFADVIHDWGRGTGNSTAVIAVQFSETQTSVHGWGFAGTPSVTGPALTYDTWHRVQLQADACTGIVRVVVDDETIITTPPGMPPRMATETATVLVGQPAGAIGAPHRFYYDDVSLRTAPCR